MDAKKRNEGSPLHDAVMQAMMRQYAFGVIASTMPDVNESFNQSLVDVWSFAEWCGLNYVMINNHCWVHKNADPQNKDNWKGTGELWAVWWENYCKNYCANTRMDKLNIL